MAEEEAKIEQLEKQLSTTLRQVSASQNLVAGLNEDVRCGHEDALALRDQVPDELATRLPGTHIWYLDGRKCPLAPISGF